MLVLAAVFSATLRDAFMPSVKDGRALPVQLPHCSAFGESVLFAPSSFREHTRTSWMRPPPVTTVCVVGVPSAALTVYVVISVVVPRPLRGKPTQSGAQAALALYFCLHCTL